MIFLLVGGGETLPSSVARRFKVAGGIARKNLDVRCSVMEMACEIQHLIVNMYSSMRVCKSGGEYRETRTSNAVSRV